MKCYFCEDEVRGIYKDCSRASSKEHVRIKSHHRYLKEGESFEFVCNECTRQQ